MKQFIVIFAALLFFSTGIVAMEEKKGGGSETMIISGTIIDNMCAGANKDTIAKFITTHTKECALKPNCAASGYSLYHYGSLIPFDGPSSKKIEQFLKQKDSNLTVTVVARKAGDKYSLVSIKNK